MRYFLSLEVGGVVSSPANQQRRASEDYPASKDGPYSPFDHAVVDEDYGGEAGLAAANAAFRQAGIDPIGDLVVGHADEQSAIVQRALADPDRWGSWLRVTDNPDRDGWGRLHNIFGGDPMKECPELHGWRATPFFDDQWALNADNPHVVEYLCDVAERMVTKWGYNGLRLDAVNELKGIPVRAHMHHDGRAVRNPPDPAGRAVARAIQQRLNGLRRPDGRRPFTIGEAGGTHADIAPWLDVLDFAYDFTWMPTLLQCLDWGDWTPLRELWRHEPVVKGQFVRYLGSHDQRDFRYVEYCAELVRQHRGRYGQFECYGGTGVTRRVRDCVVGDDAMVLLEGVTILFDGLPLLFEGDPEGYGGPRLKSPQEPRDENRGRMPWDATMPNAGWPDDAPYPLEPSWPQRSVQTQLEDPSSPLRQVMRFTAVRADSAAVKWGACIEIPVSPADEERRVIGIGRITDDGQAVIGVANASTYIQTVYLDLHQWPHKLIHKLVTDSRHYGPGSPALQWRPVYSWGAGHEIRVHLRGHELAVFQLT
jgi:glycosidase